MTHHNSQTNPYRREMMVKLSANDNVHTVSDLVEEGEAWATGVFGEAIDLYKVSSAVDGELPTLIERFVGEITRTVTEPQARQMDILSLCNECSKHSGYFDRFTDEVVVPHQDREKRSFMGWGDEDQARRTAASLRGSMAPARMGAFGRSDPMFDLTRGLKKLDSTSSSALRYLALTPEQRVSAGVYFTEDLPTLAKNWSPQARSLREATLLGAQRGVRRANEEMPGLFSRLRYGVAGKNAERLALKAQRSRLHGQYPGLFGTLEAAAPTLKDKITDAAGDAGLYLRNLPTGAQVGLGAATALGGGLALREYLRGRDAERRRVIAAASVPAPAAAQKEINEEGM